MIPLHIDNDVKRPAHLRRARYYTHAARPDRIPEGHEWPSVTTVCDLLGKVWMAPWAAKKMFEEIEQKAGENTAGVWTTAEALEIAKEAKGAWRRTRDTAAQTGTDLHTVFESVARGVCVGHLKDGSDEDRRAYEWAGRVYDYLRSELPVTVFSAEQIIASPEGGGYAGRYDAVVALKNRKRLGMLDLKTGKNLPQHCGMQLAAYMRALKFDGIKAGWGVVLHAPADGSKIGHEFYSMRELAEHWRAFLALRRVWSWHEKHGGE